MVLRLSLRSQVLVAVFAAYLPASSLPAVADSVAGGVDPAVLVVPFCAAFGFGFLGGGWLADRFPAERVLTVALTLLAGAGVLAALAPGEGWVIVARSLEGLAAAGVPPAAQRALTSASGDGRAGRALGGMMIAVALATLAGPVAARVLTDAFGFVTAALVLAALVPAAIAMIVGSAGGRRQAVATPAGAGRGLPPAGVLAGWAVAALVLAGYWTVLTRLATTLDVLAAPAWLAAAATLTGALGIPLVVVAGHACDRYGPRGPMLVTMLAGAACFAGAAVAPGPGVFVVFAGGALAAYWAYLPVVSVQVQRSAALAVRGRAVGGLYASMWLGAALAGAAASLAPSWRWVLAGAAASWLLAALITLRTFLATPAVTVTGPRPGPGPRAARVTAGRDVEIAR